MAKIKTPAQRRNVTRFPARNGDLSEPSTPESAAAPANPPVQPPKPRLPGACEPEVVFFNRVAGIQRADWGARVLLYLYQLEPICNLKGQGGKAYLMRYSEPVRDLQQILLTHGSGRYRFMLVMNKMSADASNE